MTAKRIVRTWTPGEDQILRELCAPGAPSGCTSRAAEQLRRTRLAVSLRMFALGLTDRRRPRSERQLASVRAEGLRRRGKGKCLDLDEPTARKLFEQFRRTKVSMRKFGRRVGFHGDGLALAFRRHFPDEYEMAVEQKSARRDLWYRRGRNFEYTVRNYLRARGWWVLRSPQSKSPVDLVCLKVGQVLMVQCKSGARTLNASEKIPLVDLAQSVGAIPVLAYREGAKGIDFRRCETNGYSEMVIP